MKQIVPKKNALRSDSIIAKINEMNITNAFVTDGKKERKISILSNVSLNNNSLKPRIKSYEVKDKPDWFSKNKIIPLKNKLILEDLEMQSMLISDEINVILDNLKVYRSSYLENGNVIFINIDN
jgi:hypothetical protein